MAAETSPDDFFPSASWENLRLRSDLLRRTREFFYERIFLEVETPLLSADVVVDEHLDPIAVLLPTDPRQPRMGKTLWLQTSPEFGMKRLMAAGGEAIFQITRAFRAGEFGRLHNPEFTMLEWYRRGDDLEQGMQLLSDLADELLGLGPAERLSYGAAFKRHVGIDPHAATGEELISAAAGMNVPLPESLTDDDRDGCLNVLLAECVQPRLGRGQPTILFNYPASQAALAQVTGNPPVAERFELYVNGVELANGYHELVDPAVLEQRNIRANQRRAAAGKPPLPVESRLLTAMRHGLPDCTGVALGFDRVVMLAAGATSLDQVLAFPIDRA